MEFTALHRLLGRLPGPLSDEMLDEAIAQGIAETDDLDWKKQPPAEKDLAQSDIVKDIAAMANSGGGLIIFGMDEDQKKATYRIDVGDVTESYERTLRRVAVNGIHPPVFNLGVHRLGIEPRCALAVVVPASFDVPHLIYRGDYFGAPIRNNADTEWMKERQLEAMYRMRLDDRRNAGEALTRLYSEVAAGRNIADRAWLIAVARPRVPYVGRRMRRDEARDVFDKSGSLALVFAGRGGIHPLETVDRANPRVGLRRWTAPNTATTDTTRWKEAWASVHDDGSVTLAAATGGHRSRDGYLPGHRIESSHLECCVADLMGLLREVSDRLGTGDYEIRIGIEWTGDEPLVIETVDGMGFPYSDGSIPLPSYTPITASVRTDIDSVAFLDQVCDLANDAVNQGGVQHLRLMNQRAAQEIN
jgi:hypothetical protein